jgi:hypothetical protein
MRNGALGNIHRVPVLELRRRGTAIDEGDPSKEDFPPVVTPVRDPVCRRG